MLIYQSVIIQFMVKENRATLSGTLQNVKLNLLILDHIGVQRGRGRKGSFLQHVHQYPKFARLKPIKIPGLWKIIPNIW